jgi:hypothetical protein
MSNFIGGYPQITEVGGEDLLPVIQDGELKNATRNSVLGYASYIPKFTQTSTDNPITVAIQNTTGETFSWVRTGVGQYNTDIPTGVVVYCPFISDYQQGATVQKVISGAGVESGSIVMYYDNTNIYLECYDMAGDYIEYSTLLGITIITLPEFKFFPA